MTAPPPPLGRFNNWKAPLFVAILARDSHSSWWVGPQLVPFSRLSSPPGIWGPVVALFSRPL